MVFRHMPVAREPLESKCGLSLLENLQSLTLNERGRPREGDSQGKP